jgi:adenine-specific DNA-methyltransferase
MISVAINPAAVARKGYFGRSDEYYFFLRLGIAAVQPLPLGPEWLTAKGRTHLGTIRWDLLRRSGASPTRAGHPGTFYPIFVAEDGGSISGIGQPVESADAPRSAVMAPAGTVAVWPIRQNGSEGRWSVGPDAARSLLANGYLRLGEFKGDVTPIYFLGRGEIAKIETGLYEILGRATDGSVITSALEGGERAFVPGSQWRLPAHDSTQYGSRLLSKFLPGRAFPYPKSLYAVEDALRFFVRDKPDAVILDFFAGSSTTAHAVARLNRQDGGRRQSIMITNNEVSVDEAKELRARGLRPGDPEWEAVGIFQHITRPRVEAAITGRTPDGDPIAGDYKFTDEFPIADGFEENVEFLELRYLDADDVDLGHAFDDIAPLLWLRAGGQGPIARRVDGTGALLAYVCTDRSGVLFDDDRWRSFVSARPQTALTAFIVTYSPTVFGGIAAELPTSMDTIRLYDTYLSMFLPERGRA